ncbi:DNA primase [Sporichthya brevicatena]|uniref:DNA primase n=1 Tax=Sporichthya brevicatena TaxID=171442 RepID=A0ABN1H9T1_9ACTN
MAGRIKDEDIALVRERSRIEDVIGAQVGLRNAGGGSLKGLCPFHDEKSPSFNVNPAKGFFHCFGCGEGGDVIDFVMKTDHLTFAEAVERLASRAGITLRYEEGGSAPRQPAGRRTRLVEANTAAAEFYANLLVDSPEAVAARRFLDERGFTLEHAQMFGVGYAPRGWDELSKHLRGRQFTGEELIGAGLAREGQRGLIDRFMGRLLWPIRDITGDVVGFGARRLYDDDRIEAKYVNTPETSLYKKSHLLYGLDLAKKEIKRRGQAVIVEGYTDVMACHIAGVPTAIATCGTAFGSDHVQILRRLLMDASEFRGEVIFTFDGDAAGQKAAQKAYDDQDQRFMTQTFVAVEPDGLDPCDLRLQKGDDAVRELVASRVPLVEFAIRAELKRYNLDTAEGRVSAMQAAAPKVINIRDRARRHEYGRLLAGWLGMEVDAVMSTLSEIARRGARSGPNGAPAAAPEAPEAPPKEKMPRPDPRDPSIMVERELLKVALQYPQLAGPTYDGLEPDCFTAPAYRAIHEAIVGAGGTASAAAGDTWVGKIRAAVPHEMLRGLIAELAVESLRAAGEPNRRYAWEQLSAIQVAAVSRRIDVLKGKLQRMNPVEETEAYNRQFGEVIALEQYRHALRERVIDGL